MRPKIKNSWVLQHDYAHSHIAFSANPFLASKNIPVAPQPPYLPDLSTFDFFFFLSFMEQFKGHRFGTLADIQKAVTNQLNVISISVFHYSCVVL